MNCFYCKEKIIPKKNDQGRCQEARYMMVPIERPYLNLFFHPECYKEIQDIISVYLTKELSLVYNYN